MSQTPASSRNKTTILLILAGIVGIALLLFFDPLRDRPGDPGYGPEDFRFEDFKKSTGMSRDGRADMLEVLNKIIPKDTSKQEVDAILVENGGAEVTKNQGGNNYSYMRNIGSLNLDTWNVRVIYDENMKSKSLNIGTRTVY